MTRLVNFRTAWALLGAGAVCLVAAVFLLVHSIGSAFGDAFFSEPCATPCSMTLDLSEGTYVVFERVGVSKHVGPVTSSRWEAASISPSDVVVTARGGSVLAMSQPGVSQTIDRNGTTYGGVASFDVPAAGSYEVSVEAPDPTRVVIAPSLGETFVKALPGLGIGLLGSLALTFGLGIGLVARGRRRASPGAPSHT